jgi:hypothetical protein
VGHAEQAGRSVAVATGIDVSHYQGSIDWSKVDVDFAWMKSSEASGYRDPTYARNRAGAKAHGIPSGAYHFLRPGGDPVAQARFWRSAAGSHGPGDLRPAADLEVPGFSARWLHAFMGAAEAAFGVRPVLYTYLSYVRENGWLAEFTDYPLWLAAYTKNPPPSRPWPAWVAWQFTDHRATPGIGSAPDGNTAPSLDPLLVPGAVHTTDVVPVTPANVPTKEDDLPARIVMIPPGMDGYDGRHWVTNGIQAAPIATPDDEQWLVDWLGAERDPNGNPLFVRPSQLNAWRGDRA